jgi:diaminohydroxyphosphoribosylaminopyrimidine deaminase/5-amino-6-(5-phosphoribosylamino)uracil reductase
MERALELARAARGSTSPNPPVGAVLIKDGRVIGEGYTQPPGGLHAERVALAAAGDQAAGSTLYVTLEPCSHWGRTPPCVDAIVVAGVHVVHVAAVDPNPLVHGDGVRRLQAAGIHVVLEPRSEARELIEGHAMLATRGRPFVTAAIDPTLHMLADLLPGADVVFTACESEPAGARRIPRVAWDDTLRELAADGAACTLVLLREADADEMQRLLDEGLPDKLVTVGVDALPAAWRGSEMPWPGDDGAVVAYRADGLAIRGEG